MGKERVEPLNRTRLTANAYRVLGVPAGASQAEVEAAARKMRIWAEADSIPPTAWDLPWLGDLSRGRNEIELALAVLNEPRSRIDQRLFWFSEAWGAGQGLRKSAAEMGGHDPALAEVAGLMVGDEKFEKIDRWGKALSGLREAAASERYRDWFLNVEREGDFEKRAGEDEVVAALAGVQESIAQSVAARMKQFIDAGDLDACLRLVKLLPAAGVEGVTARRIQTDVCNRVEDLLVARCVRLCDDLHRGLSKPVTGQWKKSRAAKKLCAQVESEIEQSVNPLLEAVTALEGVQTERLQRLGVPVARMMRNLWIGWTRAGKPHSAKHAMRRAQRMARGTPLEIQLLAEARPKPAKSYSLFGRQRWWRLALPITVSVIAGVLQMFSTNSPQSQRPIQAWQQPQSIHMTEAPRLFQPSTPNANEEMPAVDQSLLQRQLDHDSANGQTSDMPAPVIPDTTLTFDRFAKPSKDGK